MLEITSFRSLSKRNKLTINKTHMSLSASINTAQICYFGSSINRAFTIKTCAVRFPNSVGKILPLFVVTGTRLFYIRSKIFFQIRILQILLFQMIYCLSSSSHIFMGKLSVYEKSLHLTELGSSSLILMASKTISLILTPLSNYIEKFNFRKKNYFSQFFHEKGRVGV